MDHKLDIPTVLKAYEQVVENGKATEDGHVIDGLIAKPGLDDYTVFLTDGRVKLYVYFHNKYNVEYERRDDFDHFVAQLEKLAAI